MRIAVPVVNGVLSPHFGHCETFSLIDTDGDGTSIAQIEQVSSPPHEPGLLPAWLAEREVNCIIAGGMGQRARDLFDSKDITVVVGAPTDTPENLAKAYLNGDLQDGENACDH
jgi:predicted Fe-Mo cluster-binding NifX family protein